MGDNKVIVIRTDALERERSELLEVKQMVESELFQKYFAEKIHKKKKALKSAYDCKNMEELKKTQGKAEGYEEFYKCIQEIDTNLKFVQSDLNKLK